MNIRDLIAKMDEIESKGVIAEAAPTEFSPTHFHKNNLGGKIPLMLGQDGQFYWQSNGQITPWQGNAENRSSMNPASVDGEIKNGQYTDYPEGTTYKTAAAAQAADTTDPSSVSAVNGSDKASDDAAAQAATQNQPDDNQSSAETKRLAAANAAAGAEPAAATVSWPTTDAEIKAFQQANGLKVDGLIGQKTMAALTQKGATPPAGFVPVANKAAPAQTTTPAPAPTVAGKPSTTTPPELAKQFPNPTPGQEVWFKGTRYKYDGANWTPNFQKGDWGWNSNQAKSRTGYSDPEFGAFEPNWAALGRPELKGQKVFKDQDGKWKTTDRKMVATDPKFIGAFDQQAAVAAKPTKESKEYGPIARHLIESFGYKD